MQLYTSISRSFEGDETPYLAQHDLFAQVPELAKDILTPDYCCVGSCGEPLLNAWFGPGGTVTPLHHDPYHNLLCQVVGTKRVLLYPHNSGDYSSNISRMYPHTDPLLFNTSQVDPENLEIIKFPLFSDVSGLVATLKPGDMLFIPRGWWHHVRALEVSFSVSFWWD